MNSNHTLTRCPSWRPLAVLVIGVIGLAGCCGVILPSARWGPEPSLVGSGVDSPVKVAGVSDDPRTGHLACGDCGEARCGACSAFRRGGRLAHGSFAHGVGPPPEPLIRPPHSRFHPVPTEPVFAGRVEYEPPRAMVPAHPKKHLPHWGGSSRGMTSAPSLITSGSPPLADSVWDMPESTLQTRAAPSSEGASAPPYQGERVGEPGRTGEIRSVLRRR
jgi:hypothetical protein